MTQEDAINRSRDALDRALSRMKRVWPDKPISEDEIQLAHNDAHFAAECIADLQRLLKRNE